MSPGPTPAHGHTVAARPAVLGPGVTFEAYVAATATDPQPGWRTLQAVQEAAFTGSIHFATVPSYVVHADHGTVYHAERCDGPSIRERLLSAGVVTAEQLERGAINIGGHEHLGRMFDRDATINRTAVVALVSAATNDVLAAIGDLPAATAAATPYRHHPAGLHHWHAATLAPPSTPPVATPTVAAPPAGIMPGRDVSEREGAASPGVRPPEPEDASSARPEVRIEWHHSDLGSGATPLSFDEHRRSSGRTDEPNPVAEGGERAEGHEESVEAEFVDFDADRADWGPGFQPYRESDDTTPSPADDVQDDDDFQIVWPDGRRHPTMRAVPSVDSVDSIDPVDPIDSADDGLDPGAPRPRAHPDATNDTDTWPDESAQGSDAVAEVVPIARAHAITAPADAADPPSEDVNDEPEVVADAVRRALRAIEDAADHGTPAPRRIVVPPPPPVPTDVALEPVPSPHGFAPPTADMHVDAVYSRALEAKDWHDGGTTSFEPPAHVNGNGNGTHDGNERRGALRRLISSLRRA